MPVELQRDVSGRALALRDLPLDRFFSPRRIVVVGASDRPGSPNTGVWRRLAAWADRHGAEVVPVNPTRTELDGRPCASAIADVDGPIDLAVILVQDAVGAFRQACDHGAAFAVIFSAGFAEAGPEGVSAQGELARLVAIGPTHLLGPNTNLNAFETFRDDLDGPAVALVTQSGHQGRPLFELQAFGIRFSHWAPTGNEVDLESADFVAHLAERPEVGAIAAYIEGFADGRAFLLAADRAAGAGVPVVLVKVGRSAAGASMAASHTAHLAGNDRVADAALRQHGVLRVDGLDELGDLAAMFARTRRPDRGSDRGPARRNVAVYAISGGTGAHMADLVAAAGLAVPDLAPATQTELRRHIPGYLRVSNPIDSGGPPSMDERGAAILDAILADPGIDLLICPITGAVPSISEPLARDLVAASHRHHTPIFVVWGSPDGTDPSYREVLLPGGLPVFRTFGNCVRAAVALFDHRDVLDRRARHGSPFASAPRRLGRGAAEARAVLADVCGNAGAGGTTGSAASEVEAKAIIRAYGIRTPREQVVSSAAEAARAFRTIGAGGPVVLKVVSPDLAHKSDLGLVRLDVRSGAEARRAHDELRDLASGAPGRPRIDGVLVAEQVPEGIEMVAGISQDDVFGPVVMVGTGGLFVEVLDDVTFRVPPFDRAEARRMVDDLRGASLLRGHRGSPPADVAALVDLLVRLQRMALEQSGHLAELDLNPVRVLARGKGAIALDAFAVASGAVPTGAGATGAGATQHDPRS